jgi:hypothetical protein
MLLKHPKDQRRDCHMRCLAFMLAATLAAAAMAQEPGREQREVLREPGRRGEIMIDRSRVKLDELSRAADRQRRASARTFKASVVVRNESPKTIKSVSWVVSLVDPESRELIRRYEVTTEKRIAPGRTEKLSRRLPVPPARVVSAAPPGGTRPRPVADVQAVVTRVDYTDGSSAESP